MKISEDEKAKALEALNALTFSDGAGPVCSWVNEYRRTIEKALAPAPVAGDLGEAEFIKAAVNAELSKQLQWAEEGRAYHKAQWDFLFKKYTTEMAELQAKLQAATSQQALTEEEFNRRLAASIITETKSLREHIDGLDKEIEELHVQQARPKIGDWGDKKNARLPEVSEVVDYSEGQQAREWTEESLIEIIAPSLRKNYEISLTFEDDARRIIQALAARNVIKLKGE